jgi:hypothetical protein
MRMEMMYAGACIQRGETLDRAVDPVAVHLLAR